MYLSILIFPLLGSFVSGFLGRKIGVTGAHFITCTCLIISSLLATFAFYEVGLCGSPVVIHLSSWIESEILSIQWEFLFDQLTVSMFIPVLYISSLIHIFSTNYMAEDPHNQRFFSYLSLFTFFMLILVSGANYFVMFVGWEGIGVVSYLLINFWFTRIQANKAAILAFTMNRVGDMGLSIGFFALVALFGSLNYSTLFSLAPFMNSTAIDIIGLLLLSGAMAKSAQIPLHSWLPGSMEGPTPVSALIHAATLVTAGLYLLVRSSPILEYSSTALLVITLVGASTAFFAATCGLVQNDLKRIIAFSTISQLGYMVMAVGLSQYNVALMHVVNHAFFKALLFLGAGAVIHSFSDQQDVRRLGGLINFLPFTYTAMLVGTLSLLATPWLTGFYSKDLIIELAFAQYSFEGTFAFILGSLTAGLTAFYSFRLISLVFLTKPNGPKTSYLHSHEASLAVIIPLFILALFSIFFGYVFSDLFVGIGTDFFGNSIFIHPNHINMVEAEFSMDRLVKLLPSILSLLGAVLAVYLYHFTPHLFFMDSAIIRKIYTFLNGKYLFDVIYNYYLIGRGLQLGYFVSKVLDRGVIEFVGPYGLSNTLNNTGNNISKLDTGVITTYSLYITLGLLSLVFLVFSPILLDTSILNEIRLLIIYLASLLLLMIPFTNSKSTNKNNITNKNLKFNLKHSGLFKKEVNNKFVSHIRGIHTNSILHRDNYPKNDSVSYVFALYLKGIEELKSLQNSPALEQYIEDTFRDFHTMFPRFMEDDYIRIFFENKKYMDSVKNIIYSKIKEEGLSPETIELIKDMSGHTHIERYFYYCVQKPEYNNFVEAQLHSSIKAQINKKESEALLNTASSENVQPILEYTKDGVLVVDLNRFKELNFPEVISSTAETIAPYTYIILTCVTQLMLYKSVMRAYDRVAENAIQKIKNPQAKMKAIQDHLKDRQKHGVYWSLLVILGIKSIFELYRPCFPHNVNINNTNNITTNNINDNSFLFLVTFFKNSKKSIKFVILAVIAIISYIFFIHWDRFNFYFNLFLSNYLIKAQIILILILFFNIYYEIISIKILEKYSKLDKEPSLPYFYPSFIKNYLMYLYNLSRMKTENLNLVILNRSNNLFFCVIFILLLIFFILLSIIKY
uniref:NADH-ubiquinone oxidoreductase chain 5 n=1 Tax=Trametes hirsuta TaxID=5327 RepID=A0A2L2FQ47_TRAHI|nr:NADH dehydrogenase subunit 5 [Trametes hirsuta]AVG72799.1 NADH dehydrogenase subunit 5 [Trametes hirsuta]